MFSINIPRIFNPIIGWIFRKQISRKARQLSQDEIILLQNIKPGDSIRVNDLTHTIDDVEVDPLNEKHIYFSDYILRRTATDLFLIKVHKIRKSVSHRGVEIIGEIKRA